MPRYEYQCDACKHAFEVVESMKDHVERSECPQCKCEALHQVYGLAAVIVQGGSSETIGSYAERNTRRVSRDKIAEREERAVEAAEKRMGKKAIRKKKGYKPWWRKSDKIDKSLHRMTPKQKAKYIMTGDK